MELAQLDAVLLVIMQVDSASLHRTALHWNADAKGIVSISEQDVHAIYAQLAKVQGENLQLRRRLDFLEELLVSTGLTAEHDLQQLHVHLPVQINEHEFDL